MPILPAWLLGRLGGTPAEKRKSLEKSPDFLTRLLSFGRTVNPSWTSLGRPMRAHARARRARNRARDESRKRNRYCGHPLGKVKA